MRKESQGNSEEFLSGEAQSRDSRSGKSRRGEFRKKGSQNKEAGKKTADLAVPGREVTDEVFTVYKLTILHMLDRADGDLTQGMVSTFLLESGIANFVSLAESYDQLEKRGLVRFRMVGEKKFLHLTDAGRETLGFFGMQLSPQIRSQADMWLVENGRQIREEREVNAVYERMTSGVYEVRMSVTEKNVTLLEVKISVPDAASAQAIAGKWKEKNPEIYQYLIENLF